MMYKLLTGATGLLGQYLLRDLLLQGCRMAVLVRPSKHETAEQRIDAALAHWEDEWGRSLPRPVVLSGDITQPLLGLDRNQRDWLRRHCDSILHSAASLTFYEEKGEPWKSNVQGVRNVLELCRDTNVRILEHVSSAYVCGLRSGVVYESELDVGQAFGNDYERSKVQAEQLVRSDDYIEAFTVFRPSIITGDSRTGYTSTFHGFYSPLRLVHSLMAQVHLDQVLEVDYLALLGLDGSEHKNFVPVDWVSDAITSILSRVSPCNETYTLATSRPMTVLRMRGVIEQVLQKHCCPNEQSETNDAGQRSTTVSTPALGKAYRDQFAVYRSYWRNDPDFDSTNTREVLPDKPCPELSDDILFRMCEYAIDANFGWPRPRFTPPGFSVRDWMRWRGNSQAIGNAGLTSGDGSLGRRGPSDCDEEPSRMLGLTVTGPGGGAWTIRRNGGQNTGSQASDGDCFSCTQGLGDVEAEVRMTWRTFRDVVQGRRSFGEAIAQGAIVVYGNQGSTEQLESFMRGETEAATGDTGRYIEL